MFVFIALTSLSDLCLATSSRPSLSIERAKTNTNGAIALKGLRGDI